MLVSIPRGTIDTSGEGVVRPSRIGGGAAPGAWAAFEFSIDPAGCTIRITCTATTMGCTVRDLAEEAYLADGTS